MNPPPPSVGEGRVGYPGFARWEAGPRSPQRAGVEVPRGGAGERPDGGLRRQRLRPRVATHAPCAPSVDRSVGPGSAGGGERRVGAGRRRAGRRAVVPLCSTKAVSPRPDGWKVSWRERERVRERAQPARRPAGRPSLSISPLLFASGRTRFDPKRPMLLLPPPLLLLRAGQVSGNDPSAGSPTETLLRLLLPLDSQV